MIDETPGSEQQEPPAGLSMLERLMSEAIAQRLVLERLLKTSLAARAEAEQADIATLAERDFDDDLAGLQMLKFPDDAERVRSYAAVILYLMSTAMADRRLN